MKIQYVKHKVNADGSVNVSEGVTNQFGIFRLLTNFLVDHGTGVNDFDSFNCQIIDEDKKGESV